MKEKFKVKSSKLKVQDQNKSLRFMPHVSRFTVYCLLSTIYFLLLISDAFSTEKLELTLEEAIDIALKENLSLTEERLNPLISGADIKVKEGEFEPSLNLSLSESYKKRQTASILPGAEERLLSYDLTFSGKIDTGTTYELKWNNDRIRGTGYLLSPFYTSDLALTMSQPLLKGFGKSIQKSNLNIARNSLEISRLKTDNKAVGIISDTAKAYWGLSSARNDLEVAELSLRLAKNLLDEAKAKIEAGVLAPVEIYKAEAEVALREETLLKARKLISDAEDNLRAVMNLKDWQKEIIPVEKVPSPSELPPIERALDAAFKNRRDYKQASIDRKNKEVLRKFYDNQKYPDLNAFASVGLNGLNGTYSDALDKLGSGNYYSWQFGLSLSIPIGNRTAKGNYLKAKHEEEKADIAIRVIEQKIIVEMRESWRSLKLAVESIAATTKTRIAAEKRLKAEEGRFKVGMATMNDVLKFQEEYAKALSSEMKAHVDYAKAVIELERVKGTLGSQK